MKRVLAALFALLTIISGLSAGAATNPTDAYMGRWKDARAPEAEMKILPEYLDQEGEGDLAVYPIDVLWNFPEGRQVVWTMTARYNAGTGRLEYSDGTKIDGNEIVWSDSKGYVRIDGAGNMLWTDSRQDDSTKLSFARAAAPTPTVQEFADGYFRVVAGLERGTAGAALKAARTIVQVLQFAEARDLWNADGEAVQINLEAAWDSLTADERERFEAVFDDGVSDPADEAFDDYAAVKRVFDNAGVGAEMARLAASAEVRLSWELLSSATLNMGNLDDEIYRDAKG